MLPTIYVLFYHLQSIITPESFPFYYIYSVSALCLGSPLRQMEASARPWIFPMAPLMHSCSAGLWTVVCCWLHRVVYFMLFPKFALLEITHF